MVDGVDTTRMVVFGLGGGLILGAVLTAIDPDVTAIAFFLALFSQMLASLPRSRFADE